jgi:hypothetical protein
MGEEQLADIPTDDTETETAEEFATEPAAESEEMGPAWVHRAALTYFGALGLVYDGAKQVLGERGNFLERAEKRGEELEADLNQVLEQLKSESGKARGVTEDTATSIGTIVENGKAIEQEIGKMLSRLNVPGFRAQEELDEIVVEGESEAAATESMVLPVEGYDDLSAREVMDLVGEGDAESLEAIRTYEAATKNRVTVLRAIDERLAELEAGSESEPTQEG